MGITAAEADLYEAAFEAWGEDAQISMLHQEIGELMQAVSKFRLGKGGNVEEEIADVRIMLEQLAVMFDISEDWLEKVRVSKLERLESLIEKHQEESCGD